VCAVGWGQTNRKTVLEFGSKDREGDLAEEESDAGINLEFKFKFEGLQN
jgi:hypothetical protein